MKIVYQDERKCNLDNISQSIMPNFKRLVSANKRYTILEPSQEKTDQTCEKKIARPFSPLRNRGLDKSFRNQYSNYI